MQYEYLSPQSKSLIQALQKEVLSIQNYKRSFSDRLSIGLEYIEAAFPTNTFPIGNIHEFVSQTSTSAASTVGFIAGLASKLLKPQDTCVWVSVNRKTFPATIQHFGINPEQVLFADVSKPKDALWAIEETLKCDAVSIVMGEISELSFTESRRLQLAVENSNVTGLIHRHKPRAENTVACVTRWKIQPLPSRLDDGLPGVGYPRWRVNLQKVRNGKPGTWDLEWIDGSFRQVQEQKIALTHSSQRKAG